MKELLPVGFLTGAGASIPYGVPGMSDFYTDFRSFVAARYPSCLDLMLQLENNHANPDLETLIADLQKLLVADEALRLLHSSDYVAPESMQMADQLHGFLDAFIVDTCERFSRQKVADEIGRLVRLTEKVPLWIYTTNYDRTIEHACEQNSISYSDGFRAIDDNPVATWCDEFEDGALKLLKLHGSISWYEDQDGRKQHRLDRGYALPSREFRLSRQGQFLKPLMIIPTLEKDMGRSPYTDLVIRFLDNLRRTRLLVVAGSSLRDDHLRNYILNRKAEGNLHVLLIGPHTDSKRLELESRSPGRLYSLCVGFSEFLTLTFSEFETLIDRLIANPTMEDESLAALVEAFVDSSRQSVATLDELATRNPELASTMRISLDQNLDLAVRISAISDLGAHSHSALTAHLKRLLLDDDSVAIKIAAIDQLLKDADQESIESVGEALKLESSRDVQLEALLGLKHHGTPRCDELIAEAGASGLLHPLVMQLVEHKQSS